MKNRFYGSIAKVGLVFVVWVSVAHGVEKEKFQLIDTVKLSTTSINRLLLHPSGKILFVEDVDGLKIVDISDLDNPVVKGDIKTEERIGCFVLDSARNILFVGHQSTIDIFSIENPSKPLLVHTFKLETSKSNIISIGALSVATKKQILFVLEDKDIVMYDIKNLKEPKKMSILISGVYSLGVLDPAEKLFFSSEYGSKKSFVVMNLSDPKEIRLEKSKIDVGIDVGEEERIAASPVIDQDKNLLYCGLISGKIAVFDISDISNFKRVGIFEAHHNASINLLISDSKRNRLFSVSATKEIKVWYMKDINKPVALQTLNLNEDLDEPVESINSSNVVFDSARNVLFLGVNNEIKILRSEKESFNSEERIIFLKSKKKREKEEQEIKKLREDLKEKETKLKEKTKSMKKKDDSWVNYFFGGISSSSTED